MAIPRSFKQELVGVFGHPVAENPSQAMVEPALADLGLDWRYLTVEVHPEGLGDAVRGARAMGWRGFNCTIPHKVKVIDFLDELTPAAAKIGAVNCVVNREGRLVGDNTDGKGFVRSVEAVRPIPGLSTLILGAGGAARAIAVELALAGAARITVVNRSARRGEALARQVGDRTGVPAEFRPLEGMIALAPTIDLFVNATSVGLYPDVDDILPVDTATFSPGLIVCDVIPNPPRTRLIRDADFRGCIALDGLGMLVGQGVIGIKLWSGLNASPDVMRRALVAVFKE